MNYEKGSEWRKWDLHVHTKGTAKNDQFTSSNFNDFCVVLFEKALENNIAAIGITDYFSIENYKKVKKFVDEIDSSEHFDYEKKIIIKNIFVMPNVELRMTPTTDQGNLINIHCLFNPDENFLNSLENDFFGSLEDSGGNKMNKNGITELGRKNAEENNLSDEDAYRNGVNKFHVDIGRVKNLFDKKKKLKENTIVVVSNSSNDGASGLQDHYSLFANEPGSTEAIRENIYELSDVIFSGNPRDREFFLGKKEGSSEQAVIQKCGSLKPCIHGSDAHSEERLFNPDENRHCWIKSDPTFEGLKQIICEPKDRVKIQENKPEEKSSYQVIKSIRVDIGKTCKQTIQFNPNLNTIIGGRSTGKSTLLQIIATKINSEVVVQDFVKSLISKAVVTVVWQDGEEDKDRDIEFFPQNHMHTIANEEEKKDELIKSIIKVTKNDKLIKEHENFCATNRDALQANVDNLFKLQNYFDQLREELKEKGDKDGLEKEIKSLKSKIDDVEKGNDFSTDQQREYEETKQKISECEQRNKKLVEDIEQIEFLKDQDLFDASFGYKFNQLSDLNSSEIEKIFEDIKQESEKIWRKRLTDKLREINKQIKQYEHDIKNEKNSNSFKKGSKYLEKNNQYKELNDRLTIEKGKLTEIKSIQRKITETDRQIQVLLEKTIDNHKSYADKNNQLVNKFSLEYDDIAIKIKNIYQEDKCEELLKDFINLQSHERQKFVTGWSERYKANIKTEIADFITKALNKNIELKAYKNIKDLTKGLLVENWFSISYELTYQNDIFENMSDGKKAFVILKLLLEFSNKKCPILIDQPEDSLDNRAIYNELVTYIRKKKKERQIILVTHNANIVVNADAEEVIVANQHGNGTKNKNGTKFQYISGSLENTHKKDEKCKVILDSQGIREHVCELLEGGVEAFAKRENKYGIRRVMK